MKQIVLSLAALSMLTSVPAWAGDPNAKRLGCYRQVEVPAKYSVKRIKIKDSYRQYVKRANGRIDLMEYPAVYREEKTLVAEAEIVMRQVNCSD